VGQGKVQQKYMSLKVCAVQLMTVQLTDLLL